MQRPTMYNVDQILMVIRTFEFDLSTVNLTQSEYNRFLEDNNHLILAILECRSRGMLSESPQYEDQVLQNLVCLAEIVHGQPQTPSVTTPRMMPHEVMPQVRHYMQQAPTFPPVGPFQFNLQQIQEQQWWQWQQQQRWQWQQQQWWQWQQQQQQQQWWQWQQQQHYQLPVLPLNLAMRTVTLSAMPTMHAEPTNSQETGGPTSEASAVSHISSGESGRGNGLNLPE